MSRATAKGTFAGPNSFQGIEPTFSRLDLAGLDIFDLRVLADGTIIVAGYTNASGWTAKITPDGDSTLERWDPTGCRSGSRRTTGARRAPRTRRSGCTWPPPSTPRTPSTVPVSRMP